MSETKVPTGLYCKYDVVLHADGMPVEGVCFVLRPDRDPVARIALRAYAEHTSDDQLKADLLDWLDCLETPTT